jgi:hypothetical protein
MATTQALERELATFEKLKADLLKNHAGKFALIKGDELIEAFDTPDNAYQMGISKFGREPFLVKRVSETEDVYQNHALFSGLMHARL